MAAISRNQILVVGVSPQVSLLLERVLSASGYTVTVSVDRAGARKSFQTGLPALIFIGEKLGEAETLELIDEMSRQLPAAPLILFTERDLPDLLKKALRAGVSDYLCLPLRPEDIQVTVQANLEKARQRRDWVLLEARRATASLQRRVDELENFTRLGRSITGSLDLDSVLAAIVDTAVTLTGAEEGSLLLLDEETGELYMRAARNFQDEFVRTFRLPVTDKLVSQVLSTGEPVLLDEKTPQKIKTSYLVHSLAYVPLKLQNHVFGVLGVDNRRESLPFQERDIILLSAVADYAVIAIENARLYSAATQERNKLETVLTRVQDGVILLDEDERLVLVNQTVQSAFNLEGQNLIGRPFGEVFPQPELVKLFSSAGKSLNNRTEIAVEDGRFFSVQLTPIPAIGLAITLHDITYLKKLDRIKSDFVSTVSHDLRSPLTAIMGYVELIERAGPINDRQRDFIRRVNLNVLHITRLIDDLLNLGHIESGFDLNKETVHLKPLIELAEESFTRQVEKKALTIENQLPADIPPLLANPVQIRQMLEKLLDNAIKYSPANSQISLSCQVEQAQIILQVKDSGIGIPPLDMPYIFDKFYRGSNIGGETPGSGLGLAIVKSIVENHQGRIWVDSTPGRGTTFTVVLPLQSAEDQPQPAA